MPFGFHFLDCLFGFYNNFYGTIYGNILLIKSRYGSMREGRLCNYWCDCNCGPEPTLIGTPKTLILRLFRLKREASKRQLFLVFCAQRR